MGFGTRDDGGKVAASSGRPRKRRFLDARVFPHQNVDVRGRLIAIVIALAVLAFADICYEQASTSQPQSNAASGQLADPPAPEPAPPAIITAAVSTSAPVRTVFVVESRHQLSPALSALTVGRPLPVVAHSTGRPRSFPLLILIPPVAHRSGSWCVFA